VKRKGSGEVPRGQARKVAEGVREQLARRRWSRERLAAEAKISVSTLEKALAGSRPFTLATTVRLEAALGTSLRPVSARDAVRGRRAAAPVDVGAYSRKAVEWLEGDYVTLRPSFESEDAVYAYRTVIAWDDRLRCLAFREAQRVDASYAQKGVVSVPHQSGYIYLCTNERGQMRLAILCRPRISGEMFGLLSTLHAGRGSQLVPVAVPFVLIPARTVDAPAFGVIGEGHPAYGAYRAYLGNVAAQGFARFGMG
jgi:transcriptional regulator with XRE-family HTH domain